MDSGEKERKSPTTFLSIHRSLNTILNEFRDWKIESRGSQSIRFCHFQLNCIVYYTRQYKQHANQLNFVRNWKRSLGIKAIQKTEMLVSFLKANKYANGSGCFRSLASVPQYRPLEFSDPQGQSGTCRFQNTSRSRLESLFGWDILCSCSWQMV